MDAEEVLRTNWLKAEKKRDERRKKYGFLNVSGSVVGDYGRTSVDMVCPNCTKVVAMKVTTANLICPECRHKVSRWRSEPSQTVTLSERDVARVLKAVEVADGFRKVSVPRTPEGWPVPSRRLLEEIKKLL